MTKWKVILQDQLLPLPNTRRSTVSLRLQRLSACLSPRACERSVSVSGAENGAERPENRVERSGAVSERGRKTVEQSGARSGRSRSGNGAGSGGYRIGWSVERLFRPLRSAHVLISSLLATSHCYKLLIGSDLCINFT